MAAAVLTMRSGEVSVMPDTGFTVADRETLTTVKVQLGYLLQSVQDAVVRIAKLEETRLTARDLEDLMSDTDTLRKEKQDLEKRVTSIEQWMWKVSGGAIAVGAISGAVFHWLVK